jgi:hypothetical protein
MSREARASIFAVSIDNVNNTWRETGLFDQSSKEESTERCLLSWLEYDSVTAS